MKETARETKLRDALQERVRELGLAGWSVEEKSGAGFDVDMPARTIRLDGSLGVRAKHRQFLEALWEALRLMQGEPEGWPSYETWWAAQRHRIAGRVTA